MKKPIKLVAICYDNNENVKSVSIVKNIDEDEYSKLMSSVQKIEDIEENGKAELKSKVRELENKLHQIEQEIKTLKGEEE